MLSCFVGHQVWRAATDNDRDTAPTEFTRQSVHAARCIGGDANKVHLPSKLDPLYNFVGVAHSVVGV